MGRGPDLNNPRWFNVAAAAWALAEIAAQGVLMSRYFDTLMLGLAIHFVSALWILPTQPYGDRMRKAARLGLAAWVVVFGFSLGHAERRLPRQIEAWRKAVETGGETSASISPTATRPSSRLR